MFELNLDSINKYLLNIYTKIQVKKFLIDHEKFKQHNIYFEIILFFYYY